MCLFGDEDGGLGGELERANGAKGGHRAARLLRVDEGAILRAPVEHGVERGSEGVVAVGCYSARRPVRLQGGFAGDGGRVDLVEGVDDLLGNVDAARVVRMRLIDLGIKRVRPSHCSNVEIANLINRTEMETEKSENVVRSLPATDEEGRRFLGEQLGGVPNVGAEVEEEEVAGDGDDRVANVLSRPQVPPDPKVVELLHIPTSNPHPQLLETPDPRAKAVRHAKVTWREVANESRDVGRLRDEYREEGERLEDVEGENKRLVLVGIVDVGLDVGGATVGDRVQPEHVLSDVGGEILSKSVDFGGVSEFVPFTPRVSSKSVAGMQAEHTSGGALDGSSGLGDGKGREEGARRVGGGGEVVRGRKRLAVGVRRLDETQENVVLHRRLARRMDGELCQPVMNFFKFVPPAAPVPFVAWTW